MVTTDADLINLDNGIATYITPSLNDLFLDKKFIFFRKIFNCATRMKTCLINRDSKKFFGLLWL